MDTTLQAKTPDYGKKNNGPMKFTLVVDDFGVKYSGKDHALHLKAALDTKYKLTTMGRKFVHEDSTEVGL